MNTFYQEQPDNNNPKETSEAPRDAQYAALPKNFSPEGYDERCLSLTQYRGPKTAGKLLLKVLCTWEVAYRYVMYFLDRSSRDLPISAPAVKYISITMEFSDGSALRFSIESPKVLPGQAE